MARVSCTFGGSSAFHQDAFFPENICRNDKIQTRLIPNIPENQKILNIPKLQAHQNEMQPQEHPKSILIGQKHNSKLNIPPPLVIQSPRIKVGFTASDMDSSDDDLLLPTEMAAKVALNQKHGIGSPICIANGNGSPHSPNNQNKSTFSILKKTPNSLPTRSQTSPDHPKRVFDLPPLFTQDENTPILNNNKPFRSRLLSDGMIFAQENKSKTPTAHAPNFWKDQGKKEIDSFTPIAFDNQNTLNESSTGNSNEKTGSLPPPCDTPSRIMLEMKVREAQETVDLLNEKWQQTIEESRNNSKLRMERLLSDHAQEMAKLSEKYDVHETKSLPTILKVTKTKEGKVLYAKIVEKEEDLDDFVYNEEEDEEDEKTTSQEYLTKRKELVEKQTKEIIELNTDCRREMQSLLERKEKELERPVSKLDTLINEFNILPGTRTISRHDYKPSPLPVNQEDKEVSRLVLVQKP